MAGKVLQMRAICDEESTECCICGVIFASTLLPSRRKDGQDFYCPNGHGQRFTKTEAAKLREQLSVEQARREQAERDLLWAQAQERKAVKKLISQTNSLAAGARKWSTRIQAGVCPHCQRTFKQLAAHMKCKHGELTTARTP